MQCLDAWSDCQSVSLVPPLALFILLTMAPPPETGAWRPTDDGLVVKAGAVHVRLRVLSENAIRVVAWPAGSPEPSRASLAVIAAAATSGFETREEAGAAVLRTPRLTARVSLGTGEVAFEDEAGRPLLREKAGGGKTFTPVKIFGETTLMVRQELEGAEGESLYGLGQHQDRLLDLAGRDLDLWQHNREVVVPFLVSTRRWGLLWDNPAHMRFGRPEDVTPLPSSAAVDESGQPGRFTAAFFADRDLREALTVPPPSGIGVPPASGPETVAYGGPPTSFAPVSLPPEIVAKCLSARWTGFLSVPRTGEYSLYVADAVGEAKLWVDDRLVVDSWSPSLRATDVARLRLESGRRHAFRLEWKRADAESTLALAWLPPARGPPADLALVRFRRGHRLRLRARDDARRGDRRLPRADGARRAAASLGPRLLAEPRALQDGGRARGHGEGVPRATLPARRDRAGLAVLARGGVGLARLRPRPLSRPEGRHGRHPRPRGESDDLGLAEVLPGHRELRRAAEGRPALPAQPRHRDEGLARPRLHELRRLRPRGAAGLLAAARAGALLEGHRRVLARRHRARGAAEPGAGRPRHPHEPDRSRPRRPRAQRLPADGQPRRVRGAARRGPGEAGGDPGPFGLGRLAALRGHRVVGGRRGALEHPARAGAGGAVVLALRDAVVDDRHRRLQRGRSREATTPRPTASSTPAGSSSAPSARSSAPTAPTPRASRGSSGRRATRPGGASCASRSCATGFSPTSTRSPRASPASTTR